MHATYCFLISTDQLVETSENLSMHDSPDSAFRDPINAVFEAWRGRHCNMPGIYWHTHEALLMSNGRVVQLIPEDDWRGRDNEVHSWRDDEDAVTPIFAGAEANPWTRKITLYAYRCAAMCMFRRTNLIGGRNESEILTNSIEELDNWFCTRVPREIAELYNLEADTYDGSADTRYRHYLVGAFEAFKSSTVPPFATRWCAPEMYRCFDLRPDRFNVSPPPGKSAYLLTDIRTP